MLAESAPGHAPPAMRLKPRSLRCVLAAGLAAWLGAAWSQDYEREKRWEEQTLATLFSGEAVYLQQAQGHRFLALHAVAAAPRGAVVIVHGRGWGPDFELYGTLRTQLAEAGYTTLSIQMAVLPGTANFAEYLPLYPDAAERIRLALDWLAQRGEKRIALVAHSLGATLVNRYLTDSGDPRVGAWVAISIINGLEGVQRIRVPVLDIYGTRDWAGTLYGAPERKAQIAHIAGSQQLAIEGAEHFFDRQHGEISRAVADFLDRVWNPSRGE